MSIPIDANIFSGNCFVTASEPCRAAMSLSNLIELIAANDVQLVVPDGFVHSASRLMSADTAVSLANDEFIAIIVEVIFEPETLDENSDDVLAIS